MFVKEKVVFERLFPTVRAGAGQAPAPAPPAAAAAAAAAAACEPLCGPHPCWNDMHTLEAYKFDP